MDPVNDIPVNGLTFLIIAVALAIFEAANMLFAFELFKEKWGKKHPIVI